MHSGNLSQTTLPNKPLLVQIFEGQKKHGIYEKLWWYFQVQKIRVLEFLRLKNPKTTGRLIFSCVYVYTYVLCLCMYVYIYTYIFGLPLFFVFAFISLYFLFNLSLTLSLLSGSNTLYYILPNCSNIVDYFILLHHCYLLRIDSFFCFFVLFFSFLIFYYFYFHLSNCR